MEIYVGEQKDEEKQKNTLTGQPPMFVGFHPNDCLGVFYQYHQYHHFDRHDQYVQHDQEGKQLEVCMLSVVSS